MAICEKCGNKYFTKECLKCIGKEYSERITTNNQHIYNEDKRKKTYYKENKNLNEKEKLFKTIRYAIIFFIGLLILGTITEIIISNYIFKSVEPSINYMNEMNKDLMKSNKKLLKELEKGLKNPLQNYHPYQNK